MKKNRSTFAIRTSVSAVSGALAMLALVPIAHAADPAPAAPAAQEMPKPVGSAAPSTTDSALAELTAPVSTVEIGVGDISRDSYKFGEYNGLRRQGLFGIGRLDLSGGGAYDSADATRWRFGADNLGLETREAAFEYRNQGLFRLNFGADELRHNLSDSYQTPFLGAGGNVLTLPGNWLKPLVPQVSGTALNYRSLSPVTGDASAVNAAGVVVAPSAAQLTTLNAIRAADLPAFHRVELSTTRSIFDAGLGYDLSNKWSIATNWRHERKEGLKATAMANDFLNGNSSVTLPEQVDNETEQFNFAANYAGDHGFMQAAYYGSFFRQHVNQTTWADPNSPTTSSASIARAPSNVFHQLNLTGGYNITAATKVVVTGSYGYNTQSDSYLSDASLPIGLPRGSLDAVVRTKLLDFKLTTRPVKSLNLIFDYKFDQRDTDAAVDTYVFYDANLPRNAAASVFNAALGLPANTVGSNIDIFNNRPQSKKINKLDFSADYALTKRDSVGGGYSWEQIERECKGAWIDCEDARETKENTIHAEWRSKVTDDLSARLALAESSRTGNYNSNAWLALTPMAQVVPAGVGATTSAYGYMQQTGLTGWGPIAGYPTTPLTGDAAIFSPNNNVIPAPLYGSRDVLAEVPGIRRFTAADRNRDKLRSSVNWMASERLSLQAGVDYNRDRYTHTEFGLLDSRTAALNLDASLQASETFSIGMFYSYEDLRSQSAGDGYGSNSNVAFVGRAGNTLVSGGCYDTVQARNNNAKLDPCNNWSTDESDKVHTIGFTLRKIGLVRDRLDAGADLVYTSARTDIGVVGGSYVNNPFALAGAPVLPAGTAAIYFIAATDLPRVTTRTFELRLNAQYHLSKVSELHFAYGYKHLSSNDYVYDGMQLGTLATVMPTLEQAPHYSVHVIAVSYQQRF